MLQRVAMNKETEWLSTVGQDLGFRCRVRFKMNGKLADLSVSQLNPIRGVEATRQRTDILCTFFCGIILAGDENARRVEIPARVPHADDIAVKIAKLEARSSPWLCHNFSRDSRQIGRSRGATYSVRYARLPLIGKWSRPPAGTCADIRGASVPSGRRQRESSQSIEREWIRGDLRFFRFELR